MDKIHAWKGEADWNITRTFLQNLEPAIKRAVAEATENKKDASSSEDEESNKEESGRWESAGDQSSNDQDSREGSIDEVKEEDKLIVVQQAELMEQYRNDLFSIFVIMQDSGWEIHNNHLQSLFIIHDKFKLLLLILNLIEGAI